MTNIKILCESVLLYGDPNQSLISSLLLKLQNKINLKVVGQALNFKNVINLAT